MLEPEMRSEHGEGEDRQVDYRLLCQQRGMDFVPIIFTALVGWGEQFQRQYWNPHWIRVTAEDEAMHIIDWTVGRHKEEGILAGQIRGRRCKL